MKNNENKKDDDFLKKFVKQKNYYNHSDIDVWINISIMQLLNYDKLLGKNLMDFIQENNKYNYIDNKKQINKEKIELLKKLSEGKLKEKSKNMENNQNSIIGFDIPECELYFIVGLYVDKIERNPKYQTKIIYNTKEINLYIPFTFKYKELTEDSYIIIEIYSVELPEENAFLGKCKVFLFDENYNLYQGRHIAKINQNIFDNSTVFFNEFEEEIELLINSFYGKEFDDSHNYYGEGKENEGIKIINSKIKIEQIEDNYYYNKEEKEPQIKTELMRNYDWKLNSLLEKTSNSFLVIRFPSFDYQVVYEEGIIEDYKNKVFKFRNQENSVEDDSNIFVYDTSLYKGEDYFYNKNNPITDKLLLFSKDDEIKMNPEDWKKIEKLLNTPDFIDLENIDKDYNLFWKNRYVLLREDRRNALTKILNSVSWGDKAIENNFIQDILKKWKTIELCDLLYMLSKKFTVNDIYRNENHKISNFDSMKSIRKIAINHLNKYNISELNFVLLQLVQAIRYEDISVESYDSPLVKLLIKKSKSDLTFASSFYWFIECETQTDENSSQTEKEMAKIYTLIKELFFKKMEENKMILDIIKNEIIFKKELEKIADVVNTLTKTEEQGDKLRKIIDKDKYTFMHNELHYLPIDPRITIKGVETNNCTVFKSSTRPNKYTFNIIKETKDKFHLDKNKKYFSFLFKKGDDLRQDQLILQMINYMNSLFIKEHQDYQFTIYKVLATSKNSGFVEFVNDSETYKKISENNNKLKNYFMKISKNNKEIFEKKINNYIKSLAGYSAVNYILGIGDRHNENLMFDKEGRIFHIDFGFILGNEPYLSHIPFSISMDMINCMGGKNSNNYQEFKTKSKNAYSILRDNARIIVNMFYLMIDSGIKKLNNIESFKKLHEQFYPGKEKEEALNLFIKELEDSTNSFVLKTREMIHGFAQYLK